MKRVNSRVLLTLFLLGFLALAGYGIISAYIEETVLPGFRFGYGVVRGLSLLIAYLIPLQAGGLSISYSLFNRPEAGSSFSDLLSRTFFLIIILTAGYTFLSLTIQPLLARHMAIRESQTLYTREILQEARAAEEEGRLREALVYYDLYLAMNSRREDVRKQRELVQESVLMLASSTDMSSPAEQSSMERQNPQTVSSGPGVRELLVKAGEFFEEEDYFSAHYYASLASEIEKNNRSAQILKEETWKKLNGFEPDNSSKEAASLFESKLRGYRALQAGEFLSAYYLFEELRRKFPRDSEIAEFGDAAERALETVAFFKDEVQNLLVLPGSDNILYMTAGDDTWEIVSIDRMVETAKGTYFLGVEVLGFDGTGDILYHYRAPFGKLLEGVISVNSRDRNDRQASYLPEYRVGRPEESVPVIPLRIKHSQLSLFTLKGASGPARGLFELWTGRELLEQAGYDPNAAGMEILVRLTDPFLFLILSLAAVAFGWVHRARYTDRVPFLLYLLAAALPLVLVPITDFIR